MFTRRAVAVLVALSLVLPGIATADEAVAEMKLAPPEKYAPLVWKFNEKLTPGFWFTTEQVLHIDARINFLETKAAKDCVDAQIAADKTVGSWWKIGAGILVGIGVGFCAAHSGHCGIAK